MAWDGEVPVDPSMAPNYSPPKTYSKSTVSGLQNVDPYDFSNAGNLDLRNRAEGVRGNFLLNILNGFLNIGQLLDDLSKAIRGLGSFGPGPLKDIRDGQLDLNNNMNLLSPLQDYGSAYANTAGGISAAGQFGFTNQIGPMKKCHLSGGRIILDDYGLWDIQCKIWFDWTALGGTTEWEIRILKPDGTLFSRSRTRMKDSDTFSSLDVTSVVVPAVGYQVQIYITEVNVGRGVIGGPTFNRLAVKHISRNTTTGDNGQE
ncbi:hypothetical protein [Rhodococcus sp. IEGM 1379]|uniref:hypothetical protein n=1 Tax=Rhodococcus sp. IEGM 1379 TaxID=3047086 RepID=UPI0024B85397|nr:hypothetical protein [Rhodococcus sp. IEGM 1379]MDI9914340.1 hypothetical protein [Rhodococcus sp. IEGM 1379]